MHHNLRILMLSLIVLPQNTEAHAHQLDVSVVLCVQVLQEHEAQCGNQTYLWKQTTFLLVHLKSVTNQQAEEECK